MSDYDIKEIALAMMSGGWTAEDQEQFSIENETRDEEERFTPEEIEAVFEQIRRLS